MARPIFLFLFSLFLLFSAASACRKCSRARAFLQASCLRTRYPQLCVQTLIGSIKSQTPHHYSRRELAQLALAASLDRARQARAYMTSAASTLRGRQQEAVKECLDQINDSMAQISQSIRELRRINDKVSVADFTWRSGNVMTWTSAALTDQSTCLETFPRGRRGRAIRAAMEAELDGVTRLTSNGLALVNQFVTGHRFARGRSTRRP